MPEVAVLFPPDSSSTPGTPTGATCVMASARGCGVARELIVMTSPRVDRLPSAAPGSSERTMTGWGCCSAGRVGSSPLQPSPARVTPMTPRLMALLWAVAPVFWWPATDSPAVMPKLRFPKIGLTLYTRATAVPVPALNVASWFGAADPGWVSA
jgi:hypothetical protein